MRVLVFREITRDKLFYMEVIGKLKGQNRVAYFPVDHLAHVFLRGHFLGVFAVAGDSAAHQDSLEVQAFAYFLARVVQAAPQAHALIVGVDENLDPVEIVPVRVMIGQIPGGYLVIGMVVPEFFVVHNQAEGCGNHLALVLDTDLAFREPFQVLGEFGLGPVHAHDPVYLFHYFLQVREVVYFERS